MRKILMLLIAILIIGRVSGQVPADLSEATRLPAWNLDITWHKTTLLIFPAAVQSADRGDAYILAEKVAGVGNILKVKAAQKGFEQSNLHVITTDGKVYPFTLNYKDAPATTTFDLRWQQPFGAVSFAGTALNSADMDRMAARVAGARPFLKGGAFRKYGIRFSLTGAYIRDHVMFLQFHLHNDTHLPLREKSLRFYIRDKKKARRTANRDNEAEVLLVTRRGMPEDGMGQTIVVALPQFTMAEDKLLIAELMEAGGDRNPACRVRQKQLLKVKPL